jgi:hypothetical protein
MQQGPVMIGLSTQKTGFFAHPATFFRVKMETRRVGMNHPRVNATDYLWIGVPDLNLPAEPLYLKDQSDFFGPPGRLFGQELLDGRLDGRHVQCALGVIRRVMAAVGVLGVVIFHSGMHKPDNTSLVHQECD